MTAIILSSWQNMLHFNAEHEIKKIKIISFSMHPKIYNELFYKSFIQKSSSSLAPKKQGIYAFL